MAITYFTGVGDEVLVTVCCGTILIIFAGYFTMKRSFNQNTTESSEEMNRPQHIYNNEQCPICLSTHRLAVETNCGHKFCGFCIKNYLNLRGSGDLSIFSGRLSCPMCRQDINILLLSFAADEISSNELASERAEVEATVSHYNQRYGRGSHTIWRYIQDCPVLVRHLFTDFFSVGVMWMFRLRIIICFTVGIVYLLFPIDVIPEAVFGFFGFIDDLLVFFLCALYASILYRRYILSRIIDPNSDDDS